MKINNKKIDFVRMPAGEWHLRIDEIGDVTFEYPDDNFEKLALAVDALKRNGAKKINLKMYYMPYARQDRVVNNGEALSIKVWADLINSLAFDSIETLDAHSSTCDALFNKFFNLSPKKYILNALSEIEYPILISPDEGQSKKIYRLNLGIDIIECSKKRDAKTGEIIGVSVPNCEIENRNVLVIDDICDGGATFIKLGKELSNLNPKSLNLYVSHGIFSKGFLELEKIYKRIFTTDSYAGQESKILTKYKIGE
jgi:ribose-phosphate pyrophosphokinase